MFLLFLLIIATIIFTYYDKTFLKDLGDNVQAVLIAISVYAIIAMLFNF